MRMQNSRRFRLGLFVLGPLLLIIQQFLGQGRILFGS